MSNFSLQPIGFVRSRLKEIAGIPRQGDEGAPDAWVEILPEFAVAAQGIHLDSDIVVLTWLHLASRDVLRVHPRDELSNPLTGVFATRSADRPNPIGLHQVKVLEVDQKRGLRVFPLEALDGTPVVDIKPVLRKAIGD